MGNQVIVSYEITPHGEVPRAISNEYQTPWIAGHSNWTLNNVPRSVNYLTLLPGPNNHVGKRTIPVNWTEESAAEITVAPVGAGAVPTDPNTGPVRLGGLNAASEASSGKFSERH